jgi:hypothetical protein
VTDSFRNQAGQDFTALFDPDIKGDGPLATGFRRSNGTTLNYANIIYGTEISSNTGFRLANGADDRTLWAAFGTAHYIPVIPFGNYTESITANNAAHSTFTLTFSSNGTWSISQVAAPGGTVSGTPLSGQWAPTTGTGVGAGYVLRATAAITVTNSYTGGTGANPTFTPSTSGFISLASAFTITIDTSSLIGGGTGHGTVTLAGGYTIDIQASSGGPIATSSFSNNARASIP